MNMQVYNSIRMRWWSLTVICFLCTGCVATTEVKQASSEVEVALSALREAQVNFQAAYVRELEETRLLIASAIVADAVVAKVNTLSEAELNGNLIVISEAIQNERDSYRQLVNDIMKEKVGSADDPNAVVDRVLQKRVESLRASADALGDSESAGKLRARADQIEKAKTQDIDQYESMLDLVEIEATKSDVRMMLKDLDNYLAFLQLIHGQVHEWVSTDVTVKGDEVAALIENHQELLGLGNAQGDQQ